MEGVLEDDLGMGLVFNPQPIRKLKLKSKKIYLKFNTNSYVNNIGSQVKLYKPARY